MAITETPVTLRVEHYRGQFPSDWLYVETAPVAIGLSTAVLDEQASVQLRMMSPCCKASVVAKGKHSSTAAFYSKDWTCTACNHNYGDESWRITLSRDLSFEPNEAQNGLNLQGGSWTVTDTGVLDAQLEAHMNVLDAAFARLDLIAFLEEMFNWIHEEYGKNPRGVLMAAAAEFSGRDLWIPAA